MLMTTAQMELFRNSMHVRSGQEWDRFEGLEIGQDELAAFLASVPFNQKGSRRLSATTAT